MPSMRLLPLVLLLAACSSEDDSGAAFTVQAEAALSETIPTVVTVSWTSSEASTGHVLFGSSPSFGYDTPEDTVEGTDHEALLLGMPADTEVFYQVVSNGSSGQVRSEVQSITTGFLTNDLPGLDVKGSGHDRFTVIPFLGDIAGPAILDEQGRVVWFYPDNHDLDVYRARLSSDGLSMLYNAASVSGDPAKNSALVRVALDGSSVQETPLPLLAHDFLEKPDGTLAAIVVEYRDFQGKPLRGDQIVEVAPDGTQSQVWSAWDCFDPAIDVGTDWYIGWTFVNALNYDPAEDAYYVSIRNFSDIVKIDRATRTCSWVFGSTSADFAPEAGSSRFMHEHQFELFDDSLLVFDNAGAGSTTSRVLEYAFDPVAQTAVETWSYISDPPIFTFVLGDVKRLEDGDTMVDWAVGGLVERVSPASVSEWSVATPMGYAFGFFEQETDLYKGAAR
jgi:hypothetical protein